MTPLRALLIAVGMMTTFTASNMWTKHTAPPRIVVAAQPRADTTSVLDESVNSEGVRDQDWAEPRVDLNGNEIDDAVGDYRVDPRGEMYERHAPETALIHLAPPSI